jgi:hypothetical protein
VAFLVAPVLALIAMRVRSGVWSDYDVSVPGHRAPFYRQALVVLSLGSLSGALLGAAVGAAPRAWP